MGYLSAGANRQTAVADWSKGDLLAFGADANIALWRPFVSLMLELATTYTEHLLTQSFFFGN